MVEAPGIESETGPGNGAVSAGDREVGSGEGARYAEANPAIDRYVDRSEDRSELDVALARALERASAAGQWDVVGAIASELRTAATRRGERSRD
jgi:hypothetical protein